MLISWRTIGLVACLVLLVMIASTEAAQQAVPQPQSKIATAAEASPKLPEKPLKCPIKVDKLMQFSPEDSLAAVAKACKPTGNSGFCEACLCTVFTNYVPATLRSAGVLTNTTSEDAAADAIGSCAPSAHVALLRLGTLTEEWSTALNRQCDGNAQLGVEGACAQYVPEKLPVKKSASAPISAAAAARIAKCPFQEKDIKPKELSKAKEACGGNTTDSEFCNECLCSIQSSLDTIIKQRMSLLSAKEDDAKEEDYKGCYIVLTHALVEGDVLTPDAAAVLGDEQCRPLAQMSSAERRAACSLEPEPELDDDKNATKPAATETNKSTTAAAAAGQRSAGAIANCGGFRSALIALLAAVVFMGLFQ